MLNITYYAAILLKPEHLRRNAKKRDQKPSRKVAESMALPRQQSFATSKVKNEGISSLKDVQGDRNCFFNAVILSLEINY